MQRKSHQYRGMTIHPVQMADKAKQGYKWYIVSIHQPSGMPEDSSLCQHTRTLDEAKREIDYILAHQQTA